MNHSKHFTVEELQCPTTKKLKLEPGFIEDLEELRTFYGLPMMVTSGCRTQTHNEWLIRRKYSASPNSFHLIANPQYGCDTCAVDIRRPSPTRLHKLVSTALPLGWTVGFAKTFIHLDMRGKYSNLSPIIYTYN